MKTMFKVLQLLSLVIIACGFFVPELFGVGIVAATIITPGNITWNGEEVKALSETIMTRTFSNPDLTLLHQIYPDIVAKKQIVFMNTLSKITKKDAGCGTGIGSHSITMSEKFWNPEKTKFWLQQCADDLEDSFFVWSLNKGIARKDLTGTDFDAFIVQRIEEALIEDVLRLVWFNDTAAANVSDSPAGVITDGVSLTDYNIIDGLWKQIYTIVGTTPARRYTIIENAAVTKVLQDTLASDRALQVLRNLLEKCDKRLKGASDKIYLFTDSLIDNYQTYLENTNTLAGNTLTIEGRQTGQFDSGLKFRGIPIYRFDFWDRTIRADYDNGTTYYQPHRAILTTKANLGVGVESMEAMKQLKIWHDDTTELQNFKGGFKIDAKVIEDYMIQVAY